MATCLERVVVPPPMTLDEMKAMAQEQFGDEFALASRKGDFDCLEAFGQSKSLRRGFERLGMSCQSFDCRNSFIIINNVFPYFPNLDIECDSFSKKNSSHPMTLVKKSSPLAKD